MYQDISLTHKAASSALITGKEVVTSRKYIHPKHNPHHHPSHSDLREAVARLRSADVNAVSGVLKLYIRELPEPLIPAELFPSLARMLGKGSESTMLHKPHHSSCQ